MLFKSNNQSKSLSSAKMMEKVNCDLDTALTNPNPAMQEYCRMIGATKDYIFYAYQCYEDGSGGHIIRRDRKNPSIKVYFGNSCTKIVLINDFLFLLNARVSFGCSTILAINVHTGKTQELDWLGKGTNFLVVNRNGHTFSQDQVICASAFLDQLTVFVKRRKSDNADPNNKFDIDTDYKIEVDVTSEISTPIYTVYKV